MLQLSDPTTLLLIGLVFMLAGLVKGVVGVGLPMVSLALLTTVIGLKPAVALTVVPVVVTNLYQSLAGGQLTAILRRVWSLLLLLMLATWFGAGVLAGSDSHFLTAGLGTILICYSLYSLTRSQIPSPGAYEGWLSPLVGALAGLSNGMTGTILVPGVLYLQALGLSRDALVQTLGVVFLVSGLSLGVALASHGLMSLQVAGTSAAALIPAVIGMYAGQHLRKRMSEERFRQIFFIALLLIGCNLVLRTLMA